MIARSAACAGAAIVATMATPAIACRAGPNVEGDLGSYSPPAVGAGAVPALRSRTGLTCDPGVLMLLSGNYIRATFQSRGGLTLARTGGGGSMPYVLSVDPDGRFAVAQSGTIDYMQNNLLNLLGLLGGSSAELPFFVRPTGGATPQEGIYTDRITIRWNWYLCQGIGLLGACVLGANSGSATTTVDVTLTVAARNAVVTTSVATIWDPVNGTQSPRAVPGSRQRISISLTNPDIIPSGGLGVSIRLHADQALALDPVPGSSTPPIAASATSASPPQLTYGGPADAGDDVDFSADGGNDWTHVPGAGGMRADAVRFRPRGTLAPGATFVVSFPVAVR